MEVGILCEGNYDEQAISTIVKRILEEKLTVKVKINFNVKTASGHVNKKIESALYNFFEMFTPRCDLAVIFSDSDTDPAQARNCRKILEAIYAKKNYPPYALACITPHFEQWFIKEEDALKKIFKLDYRKKLPYEDLKPKDRIKKLLKEADHLDLSVTIREINTQAAKEMQFSKLLKGSYKEFKSFYEALRGCCPRTAK